MRTSAVRARDEALRQLGRLNRWLIAGSIIVTGALTEVAANAFPGKTIKVHGSSGHSAKRSSSSSTSSTPAPLSAPSQAPQASAEPPSQETQQAAPSQETQQQAAPSQETQQQAAPTQESSPPPQEAAPEASGPVVSGGS
jgi:hypothetical protein